MSACRLYSLQRCRRPRPRRGSSLVEVVAAMAGNAAIVGLAVVSLVALGRADRAFRDRADQRRAVSQFAEQLREDVHAAEQVAWDARQRTLRFTMSDGASIKYESDKQQWARRSIAEEGQGEGELAGAFAVPRRFRLSIDPASAAAGQTVSIAIMVPAQHRSKDEGAAAELVVAVGRDLRLLHQ